jgi:hypothetical protein
VDVAVKLYHTSSSAVPVQGVSVAAEAVPDSVVPAVGLTQVTPDCGARTTAVVHSSFAGGSAAVVNDLSTQPVDVPTTLYEVTV